MKTMWDKRYGETGFAYGEEPNDFIRAMASRIPPGEVLCLGGGEGRNAVFLARQGYAVTAVDQSEVELAKARELARTHGVNIVTVAADLGEFAIKPRRYSGIGSVFLHLPAALRVQVHRASIQGLAPGGVLLMEAFAPDQLAYGTGGPREASLLYSLDDLRSDFAALRFDHIQALVRDVQEGSYHNGPASVIQICATKTGDTAG